MCVCVCGLTILPCLSIQLKEAKVFLKRKKCLYRGNISRSNDKWPESCAPFYRMTRSCYERRHRSLFELQGLGWHLHTVRLPAMLGHAAHTQKGGFWLLFFYFSSFFCRLLFVVSRCAFSLSRSLPLPDGMPITPVKWSSLSIALYIRSYFPPLMPWFF